MATVTHPSMRRVRDSSAQKPEPQSYVVEDETTTNSTPPPQPNQSVSEDIGPTVNLEEPIQAPEPEKKDMLEDLIFLGAAKRDVCIGEHKFRISTLTHREHNDLMKYLYKFGDGADLFTLRTLTLAFALKSVDGKHLEDLGDGQYDTPFDKKLAIIDSMQMSVITKLYEEYNSLNEETEKGIAGEEVKK